MKVFIAVADCYQGSGYADVSITAHKTMEAAKEQLKENANRLLSIDENGFFMIRTRNKDYLIEPVGEYGYRIYKSDEVTFVKGSDAIMEAIKRDERRVYSSEKSGYWDHSVPKPTPCAFLEQRILVRNIPDDWVTENGELIVTYDQDHLLRELRNLPMEVRVHKDLDSAKMYLKVQYHRTMAALYQDIFTGPEDGPEQLDLLGENEDRGYVVMYNDGERTMRCFGTYELVKIKD